MLIEVFIEVDFVVDFGFVQFNLCFGYMGFYFLIEVVVDVFFEGYIFVILQVVFGFVYCVLFGFVGGIVVVVGQFCFGVVQVLQEVFQFVVFEFLCFFDYFFSFFIVLGDGIEDGFFI